MTGVVGGAAQREAAPSRARCAPSTSGATFTATAPLRDKPWPAHPDYRVTCGGVEIGAGWIKVGGSAAPCARLILVHPDLGPRADRARSGPRADQGDDSVFALIRSPEGLARPRLAPLGAGALADRPSPQPRRRKRPPRWRAGAEDEADQR